MVLVSIIFPFLNLQWSTNLAVFVEATGQFSLFCHKGRVPFARSYPVCSRFLHRELDHSDEALFVCFKRDCNSQRIWGSGSMSEWLSILGYCQRYSNISKKCQLLDAGSTLNHEFIMRHSFAEGKGGRF